MPIVFGVTALTIPQALGLSILIGIFTLNSNSSNKDIDEKSFSKAVIKGITFNSIALGLGWIVTLFM
jgi:cytochrome bd-type quinol oxidase subunit 1